LEYPVSIVREGRATIMIPDLVKHLGQKTHQVSSKKLPVFYNPRMEFNRDLSVVVLNVFTQNRKHGIIISEPLTGTGIRGIRYALEVPQVRHVIIGDRNRTSVELAKKNISINNVSDKVSIKHMDANLHLSSIAIEKTQVDVVDLDPYGSPAPFLDSTARAVNKNNGLLCITATDMPALVGVKKRICIRKYGSVPLKTMYAHETALRILIAASVLSITRHGHGTQPILAHSTDHYVRIYLKIHRGKEMAKQTVSHLGYVSHCDRCFTREMIALSEPMGKMCPECGGPLMIGGPLWTDELADRNFVNDCIKEAKKLPLGKIKEVLKLLHRIDGELEISPTFYDAHVLAKRLKMSSPPLSVVISNLRRQGYLAARTHFKNTGFRTNAAAREVMDILKSVAV